MSWTTLNLEHSDEIRPAASQISGYVQLQLGDGIAFMAPIAKAAELHAVLGEQLGGAPSEQDEGGAADDHR